MEKEAVCIKHETGSRGGGSVRAFNKAAAFAPCSRGIAEGTLRADVRKSFFGLFRRELQIHGSFALVYRDTAEADQGAHSVKEAPCTCRRDGIKPVFEEKKNGGDGAFVCKLEFLREGKRCFLAIGIVQQGYGNAPAFLRGNITAWVEERREGAETLETACRGKQDFTAPYCAVRTVTRAVEAHAYDGGESVVFSHS